MDSPVQVRRGEAQRDRRAIGVDRSRVIRKRTDMARQQEMRRQPSVAVGHGRGLKSRGSLEADIIIANAPDPVFVSDLEGKILQANDAVSQLLGFQ
jgi:PAS domain-containing protein